MPKKDVEKVKAKDTDVAALAVMLHEFVKEWNTHLDKDICGCHTNRALNQRFFDLGGHFSLLTPALKKYFLRKAEDFQGRVHSIEDLEACLIEFRKEDPTVDGFEVPL